MRITIEVPTDGPAPDMDIRLRKCAYEECKALVEPGKKNERFHSEKCRMAYHNQRRKQAGAKS